MSRFPYAPLEFEVGCPRYGSISKTNEMYDKATISPVLNGLIRPWQSQQLVGTEKKNEYIKAPFFNTTRKNI